MNMRRGLIAIFTCGLVAGGIPAATARAANDGGPYRVQLIYRVGRSLAPLKITVNATSASGRGAWFATEVHRRGKQWAVATAGPLSTSSGYVLPTVYGAPTPSQLPSCPAAPTQACDYPIATDVGLRWEIKPLPTSRVYVVSAYVKGMTIQLDSKGWRVKDVSDVRARRVFANQATATGANIWGQSVEHFTEARAPGGRYGSVTFASLPCQQTGQGTANIIAKGAQEIGGDMDPQPLRCGLQTTGASWNYFYTADQATWRMTGDATGIGTNIRLFVIDLPKP